MSPGARTGLSCPFTAGILLLLLIAGTGVASGHAPLSAGSGGDLAGATLIASPEKSFVIYTALPEDGGTRYYLFPLREGQVLYGSLQVPGPDSAVPDLAIIGPGISSSGDVPPSLEVPAGSGVVVIRGQPPGTPSYEPFSPQPVYTVARFNTTAGRDGNYYVAVFGPGGGKYSLAPGFRETFTAAEWLAIPWSVVGIHIWEGQSPAFILAPLAAVLILGAVCLHLLRVRRGIRITRTGWFFAIAGLLCIGGAAMTGLQIVRTGLVTGADPGMILTLVIAGIPLVLGLVVIRTGIGIPDPVSPRKAGIMFLAAGLLGLVFWAGLIIGPVLCLLGGAGLLIPPGLYARRGRGSA